MIKIICPDCKKEYNLPEMYIGETITCAGCKNKIKVTAQGAIGTNQAKCPYCFSTVPAGAKKCLNCGEWLSPNSKPKSRAVYILLTFFLGHLGIGEAYLGYYMRCIIMVLANFVFWVLAPAGLVAMFAAWLAWLTKAFCTDMETRKLYKSANIIFSVIMMIIIAVVAFYFYKTFSVSTSKVVVH